MSDTLTWTSCRPGLPPATKPPSPVDSSLSSSDLSLLCHLFSTRNYFFLVVREWRFHPVRYLVPISITPDLDHTKWPSDPLSPFPKQLRHPVAGTAVLPLIPIQPDGGLNTGGTVPGPLFCYTVSHPASTSSSTIIKVVGLPRLAPLSPVRDCSPISGATSDQASDHNQRKFTLTGY
jgi:hypothetical protein